MTCACSIIPPSVLKRFADDPELSAELRQQFYNAIEIDNRIRAVRQETALLTTLMARHNSLAGIVPVAVAHAPLVTVYDCKHHMTLPGTPVATPGSSADPTAKRTFDQTSEIAKFFQTIFKRNSVDGAGMTLLSSIHYGTKYNNAFWNGTQMTYGDGDGAVFTDFTRGNDVMAHELTHGVTQHTLGLAYADEAGGLNESLSDVFGSMFRQWQANQDANTADWLIGHDILGPTALAKGFTCLRDMSNPAASHCLSPQPIHFSQYRGGMDPHLSSGIPNVAFCRIAKSVAGKSWLGVGQVWYDVLSTTAPRPNMLMLEFANATRATAKKLHPADAAFHAAVDAGWKSVGL
ncbi:MAG: extracellular metalloprotease [Acidobacteria bacterium]|nr:extracellular metalloprotease [Acidobacteriota bacterium]